MKKIVVPFLRTPYNYDMNAAGDEDAIECKEETLTQQHMVNDTDINYLMERYVTTGEIPQLRTPPLQGDFSNVMSYQAALNLMIQARQSFDALPARIRNRFDNDPGQFVEFCSNEANRDEMRQMGLWSTEAVKAWNDTAKAAKDAQEALQRDGEAYRKEKHPEKGAQTSSPT